MKDKHVQPIFEDLLPLYAEGMLSEETTAWMEEQAKQNKDFAELLKLTKDSLPTMEIDSPVDSKKLFQKINRKLAMFQIIFVSISFLLAINTALLNESFGFILWYTVLGLVTFLFYKDWKIVVFISFLPVFLWSIGSSIRDYIGGHYLPEITLLQFLTESLLGAVMISIIHLIFAVIGCIIAWLILKLKEGE